jgi:hypothetical protein
MNWKQFLKPDKRKIVIFVILFGFIGTFIWPAFIWNKFLENKSIHFLIGDEKDIPFQMMGPEDIPFSIGFPFMFYFLGFNWGQEISISNWPRQIIYFHFLIFDILFNYLLSCLIVWIYDKFRKKNKK